MHRILLIFVCWAFEAHSSDVLREQAVADEMAGRIESAEIIQIDAQKNKFKALYRQSAAKEIHGGLIILHDFDSYADALDVLNPLRIHLPEHGWNTLSLQVPLLEAGSDFHDSLSLLPEALERVKAGVAYLQAKGIRHVMLAGYHGGGLMALRYLSGASNVDAAVLIDLPQEEESEAMILADLAKIKRPLLDIFTLRDKNLNSEFAQKRKKALNDNPYYRQTLIIDAESDFVGVDGLLVNLVHGWMMRSLQAAP